MGDASERLRSALTPEHHAIALIEQNRTLRWLSETATKTQPTLLMPPYVEALPRS